MEFKNSQIYLRQLNDSTLSFHIGLVKSLFTLMLTFSSKTQCPMCASQIVVKIITDYLLQIRLQWKYPDDKSRNLICVWLTEVPAIHEMFAYI
jgi:hypothetical protein